MVQAWYFDNDTNVDYREPHKSDPPVYVSLEELKKQTGVEYFKVRSYFDQWLMFCLMEKD